MHPSSLLVLVDPRTQQRAQVRQRVRSVALGMLVAGGSAVPFVLALGR
jgi:hypothetical protein